MNHFLRVPSLHLQRQSRAIHNNLHYAQTLRKMTTAAPTRQRFFVYAPDKTEAGTFEKRLSVRPAHLESAKQRVSDGIIRACLFCCTRVQARPLTMALARCWGSTANRRVHRYPNLRQEDDRFHVHMRGGFYRRVSYTFAATSYGIQSCRRGPQYKEDGGSRCVLHGRCGT